MRGVRGGWGGVDGVEWMGLEVGRIRGTVGVRGGRGGVDGVRDGRD